MSTDVLKFARPYLDWLIESDIQITDGPDTGGVRAWIDEETNEGAFIYSEITGYFITLAVHLSRYDDTRDWLGRAEQAAMWIRNVAMQESGAVLTRKYDRVVSGPPDPYSFENGLTAFFDCAMVGFGLTNLYEATGNHCWLETAENLGNFCLDAFQTPGGGERFAVYDTKKGAPLPPDDRWSGHWGSFELKGAMYMDSMHRLTGDDRYRQWTEETLAQALRTQVDHGRFGTNIDLSTTHLHPHNYTLEAMLYLAGRHNREDLLPVIKNAIDFSFDYCLPIDSLHFQAWSEHDRNEIKGLRSDVLAQSLRSHVAAELLDVVTVTARPEQIHVLLQLLESYRLDSGATSYGMDEYGTKSRHANAWCHFFATELNLLRGVAASGLEWKPTEIILT